MGSLGQLILDETDFRPDFLDLSNNFTFRRSCQLPGATHKFLFVLVPTFGYHLSVVNCRFYFLKFCRLKVYKTMSDFLKVARFSRERRGPYWYRKEVNDMNVIDFFFCRGTLVFPLRLCLAVKVLFEPLLTELLEACLEWMDCRQEIVFCNEKAIQDCVFQALKR